MADWLGATIGGLFDMSTSALGSLISYPMQKKMDSKAYKRQVALLQMQQNFAERMANTAHQREVADLRKAGLNPILSATGGQGASSPVVSASGVSQGSNVDFNLGSPGDAFANVESASSALLNKKLASKASAEADIAEAKAKIEQAKAAAVPSPKTVKNIKDAAGKSGVLLTDPQTWRGIVDFFGGSSSARHSFDSKRRVDDSFAREIEKAAAEYNSKHKVPPDPKGSTLKIFTDKADYDRGRKQFYRERYRLKSPDEIRREYNNKQKNRSYFK